MLRTASSLTCVQFEIWNCSFGKSLLCKMSFKLFREHLLLMAWCSMRAGGETCCVLVWVLCMDSIDCVYIVLELWVCLQLLVSIWFYSPSLVFLCVVTFSILQWLFASLNLVDPVTLCCLNSLSMWAFVVWHQLIFWIILCYFWLIVGTLW